MTRDDDADGWWKTSSENFSVELASAIVVYFSKGISGENIEARIEASFKSCWELVDVSKMKAIK